jgi:hypothetical protein
LELPAASDSIDDAVKPLKVKNVFDEMRMAQKGEEYVPDQ